MLARLFFFINVIWKMTCLFFFPSALQKRKIDLHDIASYETEFKNQGLLLVISFGGLGDRFGFKKTLSNYPVNVIHLRDLSHQWYLNELVGVGNGANEIRNFLANQISIMQPSRVITLGTSAGGFGAMLYGALLKVDSICVFSPQTFRSKFLCLLHLDYRWLDRVVDIYEGAKLNREYLDLKPLMTQYPGKLIMYYDVSNRLDNIHGSRIHGKRVIHNKYNFGGHNLAKELQKKGDLKSIVMEILGVN